MDSRQYRLAKGMRWAGRIIGLLAIGISLLMAIGSVFVEGWEGTSLTEAVPGVLMGVLAAIGLAGCILSWWQERLASLLLALTAVGFGLHIGFFAGFNHFQAWLIVGSPYLIAAALFFVSWQMKARKEHKEAIK